MKKLFLQVLFVIGFTLINAAPFINEPTCFTQPDGTIITLSFTGDEYMGYYFDSGYDNDMRKPEEPIRYIMCHPITGYYVYANRVGDDLVTTTQVCNNVLIRTSRDEIKRSIMKYDAKSQPYTFKNWFSKEKYALNTNDELGKESLLKSKGTVNRYTTPKTGNINNIVVFIRFTDYENGAPPHVQYSNYKDMFSYLQTYYDECSYGKLKLQSFLFGPLGLMNESNASIPGAGTKENSYGNVYPDYLSQNEYLNSLNATLNDTSSGWSKRVMLRYQVLARAMYAIKDSITLTPEQLDQNGDGIIDHITFVVLAEKQNLPQSLLMPHAYTMYTDYLKTKTIYKNDSDYYITIRTPKENGGYENTVINWEVMIKGKRLGSYSVVLDRTSAEPSIANRVITHEYFHSLGASDLYNGLTIYKEIPVGEWDIMSTTFNDVMNPSHITQMTAYTKYRYGQWIQDTQRDDITSKNNVDEKGNLKTYTLTPLSQKPTNNSDKLFAIIRSSKSSALTNGEYFVVEYRKKVVGIHSDGDKEELSGLIVYRVNETREGRIIGNNAQDPLDDITRGNKNGHPYEVYIFRKNQNSTITSLASISGIPDLQTDNNGRTWISGFTIEQGTNTTESLSLKQANERYIFFTPADRDKNTLKITGGYCYSIDNELTNNYDQLIIPGSGFKIMNIKVNSNSNIEFQVIFEQSISSVDPQESNNKSNINQGEK